MAERDFSKLEINGMNPPMRADELLNFSRRASEAIRILDARTKKKHRIFDDLLKNTDDDETKNKKKKKDETDSSESVYRGPFRVSLVNGVLSVDGGVDGNGVTFDDPYCGYIINGDEIYPVKSGTIQTESGATGQFGYVYLIYNFEDAVSNNVLNGKFIFDAKPPYVYEPANESDKVIPLALVFMGMVFQVQYGHVRLGGGSSSAAEEYNGMFKVIYNSDTSKFNVIWGKYPDGAICGCTDLNSGIPVTQITFDESKTYLYLKLTYVSNVYVHEFILSSIDNISYFTGEAAYTMIAKLSSDGTVDQIWTDGVIYWSERYIV